MRYARWQVRIWILLLLVLACWLRVAGTGHYHLNADESMMLHTAGEGGIGTTLSLSLFENHPPLGVLFYHFWLLLGHEPWLMRGLSLLFGLALLPLYYRIGVALHGPAAGLSLAVLVTFSHGCIEQSYLMRSYSIFLFFLSLGFLGWLRWRGGGAKGWLIVYTGGCAAACLTHISGVFAVAVIGLLELYGLLAAGAPRRRIYGWCAANAVIAGVSLAALYYMWPALAALSVRAYPYDTLKFLGLALAHPFLAETYFMPGAALGLAAALSLPLLALLRVPGLRLLLSAALLSCILGFVLVFACIYDQLGSRHVLWQFPFLAVPPALGLALLAERLSVPPSLKPSVAALLALLAAAIGYDAQRRFNADEFTLAETDWQALAREVKERHDAVVVMERGDMFLLADEANPYVTMQRGVDGKTVFPGMALLPYGRTHILFRTRYGGWGLASQLGEVREARDAGVFGADRRIIFLAGQETFSFIHQLRRCVADGVHIRVFPEHEGNTPTRLFWIEMSRQELDKLLTDNVRIAECDRLPLY